METMKQKMIMGRRSLVEWRHPSGNVEYVVCSYYTESKPIGSRWCWGHYFTNMKNAVEYLASQDDEEGAELIIC